VNRLEPLTPQSARGKARELLGDLVGRHGDVGIMVRTMAHSSALLAGYLDLSRAMKRSKLDRALSERISLAVQQQLDCASCLLAHIAAAEAIGLDDDEIARARDGGSSDPAIAALVRFGLRVLTRPAEIRDAEIAELREHGYRDREIVEVVGIVALNQLTGAFNLVAGIEPGD
jgi:AhpD family alkylhydroperoxidase